MAEDRRSALRRSALAWLSVSDLTPRTLRLHNEVKDTRRDNDRPAARATSNAVPRVRSFEAPAARAGMAVR